MKRGVMALCAALVLPPLGAWPSSSIASAAARSPSQAIVLGSKTLFLHGKGWGTAKPSIIFNGGDPSGLVSDIRWQHWGQKTATGWGYTWIFKPTGGYYGRHVRAELRAAHTGRCSRHSPLAYLRLSARVPAKPGGPLGRWFAWANLSTLCHR